MAFPAVQTADTTNGTVTTNSGTWTLTYPANIAAGDLLLALIATDGFPYLDPGPPNSSWPSGWVERGYSSGTAVALWSGLKKADGSESGTFNVGFGANEQGAWRVFRITGWYGDDTTWLNSFADSGVSAGAGSNAPDPLSLDPANWGTEDTLWIAAMAADTSRTVTAYPSNMPDLRTADVSGGANGATLGVAMANSATESFDAAAFTISANDDWVTTTYAIRPASGAVLRTFTANAVIKKTISSSFTANAVVKRTFSSSFTADTLVSKTSIATATANAIVKATPAASFIADAVLSILTTTVEDSFTTDAVVSLVGPLFHVSPADEAMTDTQPVFVFTLPQVSGPTIHLQFQMDLADTFDTPNLRTYTTYFDATGWEYWNGSEWAAVTTSGIPAAYAGNQVRYTVTPSLPNGEWFRRIRGGTGG